MTRWQAEREWDHAIKGFGYLMSNLTSLYRGRAPLHELEAIADRIKRSEGRDLHLAINSLAAFAATAEERFRDTPAASALRRHAKWLEEAADKLDDAEKESASSYRADTFDLTR